MLLEELGVDAGVSEAERQGQGQLQETERGAGQLLDALADKQHSGVTFAEFLRYNSQVMIQSVFTTPSVKFECSLPSCTRLWCS